MADEKRTEFDTIVVGSGFGGVMAAHPLVAAGQRVLMLERGDWVRAGADSSDPVRGFFQLTPAYDVDPGYAIGSGGRQSREGICACVGGPSVYYGGASFRFREEDFRSPPEITAGSGARWPFGYDVLEPHYGEAERLLDVAGETGDDPTEPWRRAPYPRVPQQIAPVSARVRAAAEGLGLHPFRIPLAFKDHGGGCLYCDGYACTSGAKNDLASTVIPGLLQGGMELRPRTVVVRVLLEGGRAVGVKAVDPGGGEELEYRADRVVLAAGALATPQLLLASGVAGRNPGAEVVGRYLMRHCNAFVYALFPRDPNPERLHHKQVAVNDYYFGDDAPDAPPGKLGNIQQVMHPQLGGILRAPARLLGPLGPFGRTAERVLAAAVAPAARRMTGLQVIAEDQPQFRNHVALERGKYDRHGLPLVRIEHEYSERDLAARAALIRRARRILSAVAGGGVAHVHLVETFSHAVGTVRMGSDPRTSALDEYCAVRGIEQLYVTDGSFMPTSAALNPSLTIAANALRVGAHLARS